MRGDDMKKYAEPMIEMFNLNSLDVITSSAGLLSSGEGGGDMKSVLTDFTDI